MFVEKRQSGKNIKYYLVHSFRDINNKVVKLRRYLGNNLSENEIQKLSKRAQEIIQQQIDEMKTNMFEFSLKDNEIKSLNKFNDKLEIHHFSNKE